MSEQPGRPAQEDPANLDDTNRYTTDQWGQRIELDADGSPVEPKTASKDAKGDQTSDKDAKAATRKTGRE